MLQHLHFTMHKVGHMHYSTLYSRRSLNSQRLQNAILYGQVRALAVDTVDTVDTITTVDTDETVDGFELTLEFGRQPVETHRDNDGASVTSKWRTPVTRI